VPRSRGSCIARKEIMDGKAATASSPARTFRENVKPHTSDWHCARVRPSLWGSAAKPMI
jgi:hypothetical protein